MEFKIGDRVQPRHYTKDGFDVGTVRDVLAHGTLVVDRDKAFCRYHEEPGDVVRCEDFRDDNA